MWRQLFPAARDHLNFAALTSFAASVSGKSLNPDQFRHWQAREVTLFSDPPQPAAGDGEKCGETPVTVTVLPGAIGVITPAETP